MSLKSLVGRLGAGVTGFATGGVMGAVRGVTAMGAGGGTLPAIAGTALTTFGPFGGSGGTMNQQGDAWLRSQGIAPGQGKACPKGFHLNKHRLAPSKRHGWVEKGTLCVRNRHMHPLNSRAITRSLRRVKRANKLVGKLQKFSGIRHVHRQLTRTAGHRAGCGCAVCKRR
jgi:hypothetical protein